MRTIVISAVNLIEAGTLAILKDCLAYLSTMAQKDNIRVVAVVHKKELASYPHIEYIETQWPKKRWVNRLWFEYVSLKKISRQIGNIDLWFSLHDTTPTVEAKRRAVYCHNSFSSYKWKMRDWIFAPKIAIFALLTKYIYKPNIHKNNYLVVQQEWFRQYMAQTFGVPMHKIIVSPPGHSSNNHRDRLSSQLSTPYTFIFAASPNSHKNFECICRAVAYLQQTAPQLLFKVDITLAGNENKYARWIYHKWGGGQLPNLRFVGFLPKQKLLESYANSNCLIFPSKIETWGLPISEFATYNKPMLLSDLPYAHETAAGASQVAFFDPDDPKTLAEMMRQLVEGDTGQLHPQPVIHYQPPVAYGWEQMFHLLLA